MFVLKLIRGFFKGLAGAESPTQIALGFWLGLMLGLVPFSSGMGIALLLVILMFKVSFPFAFAAMAIAKLCRVTVLLNTSAQVGYGTLESRSLESLWTSALNLPGLALLNLDSYTVMGGALIGLGAGAVCFFPIRWAVKRYREAVVARLSKSKLFKTITNLWFMRALKWLLIGTGN